MIFLSSDHHFYHSRIIEYCARPFETVEEMNEKMVLKWNETVSPEDTVLYLGDFSMAFRAVELFTKRLNGEKFLIHGNHDFTHPYHKKSRSPENQKLWIQKYIDNGWVKVSNQSELEYEGKKFKLAHLPYVNDGYHGEGDKYEHFRPTDDGTILLCGHVHEKWMTEFSKKGTLMINVGVDRHDFKPISIDRVMDIVRANGF